MGGGVSYSLVRLGDIEPGGPGGAVRFVRRELGVEAFGINWFEIAPNTEGRDHDESGSGQEEVNVVIRGSGIYRIDGEDVPVEVGTFLRFDPETRRVPIAGPDGLTMLAVGARRGSYEPRGPF
jgi:mannose-6-phosphate isomerase-like protein (cupin superfamily)